MPPELNTFILLIVLTLVNAFFAAAEIATVSANKTKVSLLAEEGNKKAKHLLKIMDEPNKFLSTIQVGITLAGFYSSAKAAEALSGKLTEVLNNISILSPNVASQLATFIITIILAYFVLVFGELFPKRLALKSPEKIAFITVGPVSFVMKIFKPFVWFLSISVKLLLTIFRVKDNGDEGQISEAELRSMIATGKKQGTINETESQMINSIFEFNDITAEEIMTPRTEVYSINIEKPIVEYIDELINSKYSRIPFYEKDSDNIIGILYIKDLIIAARKHGFENVNIRKILRPAYFVPTLKKINELFKELQASKTHLAILIDEYGGVAGIVSIEDVIEEVFGNIYDEFDDDELDIKKIGENSYSVSGLIPIFELNEELNLDIEEESGDYDTLAGFIISQLGFIPQEDNDNVIEYKNLVFKIEKINDKRIERIRIDIIEKEDNEVKEEEEN